MRKTLLLTIAFVAVVAVAFPARAEWDQSAPLYWFEVENLVLGDVVEGSVARIDRELEAEPGALSMELETTGLRGGHVYTVWWMVFNEPQHCNSNPSGPVRCGAADVFNPVVRAAHILADGGLVAQDGVARFSGRVETGDLTNVAFPWEPGLVDAERAEVFLVVRDHGPLVDGAGQSSSMNGGCLHAVVMPGTGTPGTYPCENQQIAMFPAHA